MLRPRKKGLVRAFGAAMACLLAAGGLWTPFVVVCEAADGHVAAESLFSACCEPTEDASRKTSLAAPSADASDCASSCVDTPLLTILGAAEQAKRLALHAAPAVTVASAAALGLRSFTSTLLPSSAPTDPTLISISSTVLRL